MEHSQNKGQRREEKTQKTFNAFLAIAGGGYGGSMTSMIKKMVNEMEEETSTPDPALKGVKGGNCNRTACQKPGATFYNHSTREHYCPDCAEKINRMNPEAYRMFGHALCTPTED